MALYMVELLKGKQNILQRSKNFIDVTGVIKKLLKNIDRSQERKVSGVRENYNFDIIQEPSLERKWYEGKNVKDLPAYLYWPSEKRFSKVLWWGYGKDGLYFIEKGRGYVYAGIKEIFMPADERDYLQFLQSIGE